MVGYRGSASVGRKGRPAAGSWDVGYRGAEAATRMRPYEGRSYEDNELVALIKSAQRSGGDWKDKWVAYCAEYGNGTMDPSRHTGKFLVDAVRTLGIPGDISVGEEVSHNRLVEDIKQRQRSSTTQHAAWIEYCDQYGNNGRYNPAHYDKAFLDKALETLRVHDDGNYTSGGKGSRKREGKEVIALASFIKDRGDSIEELIDIVKAMQKEEPAAHVSWQEYCDARGDGTLDPKRHEYEFLVNGITFMRKSVFLVKSIKEMTRSSPERARWVDYCNDKGDGVYDPMLHNTEFLDKAFNVIASRSAGRGSNAIPWFFKFSPACAKAFAYIDMKDLVTALRLLQKEHPELSFAWKIYCDVNGERTYDPARHTDRFLREAVKDIRAHIDGSFNEAQEVRE